MVKIELQLDEQTLARACQLAANRRVSLEDLIKEMFGQMSIPRPGEDSIRGMFADEPELIDQVVEMAMKDREASRLRHENSG
jgi:hypothetical protein